MSSDPNLILKLLRKLDSDMRDFRHDVDERFKRVDDRFARVEERLATLDHTVSGMASQLFFVKTIDRRVRKLEDRR